MPERRWDPARKGGEEETKGDGSVPCRGFGRALGKVLRRRGANE
jgi:hypothetical protein